MSNNLNTSFNSTISSTTDWPSITSNNTISDNYNSIKILKRPTNATTTPTATDSKLNSSAIQTNQTPNETQNNSSGPQITLEDNTRTQYVPQVRILKRPNAKTINESSDKSMSALDRKSMTANRSQTNNKTYEEREAEYAKARLRILGSASAQEETNCSTELCQLSSSSNSNSSSGTNSSNTLSPTNSRSNSANNTPISSTKLGLVNSNNDLNNVPIIRLPLGPDGSKGFKNEKR
jgi:hypothetical protein